MDSTREKKERRFFSSSSSLSSFREKGPSQELSEIRGFPAPLPYSSFGVRIFASASCHLASEKTLVSPASLEIKVATLSSPQLLHTLQSAPLTVVRATPLQKKARMPHTGSLTIFLTRRFQSLKKNIGYYFPILIHRSSWREPAWRRVCQWPPASRLRPEAHRGAGHDGSQAVRHFQAATCLARMCVKDTYQVRSECVLILLSRLRERGTYGYEVAVSSFAKNNFSTHGMNSRML